MRRLKADPVPNELVRRIFEAGVCAPSGGNMQRGRFLVIRDPKIKEIVGAYYKRAWDEQKPRSGEAGVSRKDDPGFGGMGSSSKRNSTASASVPGSPSPRLIGCFSRHYKSGICNDRNTLGSDVLFKKTGHLKPADIRQSLNIHQDQIRAVIIQTCPCS
jgi:nitroreductase